MTHAKRLDLPLFDCEGMGVWRGIRNFDQNPNGYAPRYLSEENMGIFESTLEYIIKNMCLLEVGPKAFTPYSEEWVNSINGMVIEPDWLTPTLCGNYPLNTARTLYPYLGGIAQRIKSVLVKRSLDADDDYFFWERGSPPSFRIDYRYGPHNFEGIEMLKLKDLKDIG